MHPNPYTCTSTLPVWAVHVIPVCASKKRPIITSQQDADAYLCPVSHYFPLIYIGLLCNRHCVSWERALTNTGRNTQTSSDRERGGTQRGEENWFIITSPRFDLLLSRLLGADKGGGVLVNKTYRDRNRGGVRHICPEPIAHPTPTQFHYSLIRPPAVIKLSLSPSIPPNDGSMAALLHHAGLHLHRACMTSAPERASVRTVLTRHVSVGLLPPPSFNMCRHVCICTESVHSCWSAIRCCKAC